MAKSGAGKTPIHEGVVSKSAIMQFAAQKKRQDTGGGVCLAAKRRRIAFEIQGAMISAPVCFIANSMFQVSVFKII
jgi:hypothetical protein